MSGHTCDRPKLMSSVENSNQYVDSVPLLYGSIQRAVHEFVMVNHYKNTRKLCNSCHFFTSKLTGPVFGFDTWLHLLLVTMTKVFDLSFQQLCTHLRKTIAAHDCYRLVFENTDRGKFTIHYPAKGIIIGGTAIPGDNSTELRLNATSPFCVISEAHEQILLTTLIDQLVSALPPVARMS